MASFTDTQPLKFNQYVQQQPVEAMATVGMAKQKAHEEGIQKIQTQIDNIAGLEVARDIDKAYLQSKLNELGNNLRTVAAGDFSNFQLVSTASGMTKQLVHDKGIQNAVSSTARLKKEQAFMEEERKKGELNPANEYVFNKQVGNWYNNKDVYSSFNGKYNKYFDVDKYVKEVFSEVKPDGFTIDQIYQTDSNGNPIFNKSTGTYELSTTMKRLKKEGRFPEKVQKTLDYVFSDPRVSNQLGINGQYSYRNASNEELVGRLTESKDSQMGLYDKNIMDLTIKKSIIKDEFEKAKISKQIDDMVANKNEAIQNYNGLIENIGTNSDGVKAMLYKNETKNKFRDMYSYTVTEETVHDNPGWQNNFKMQQEANKLMMHKEMKQIELAKMAQQERLTDKKINADLAIAAMKAKKEQPGADPSTYSVGPMDDPGGVIASFDKKMEDSWKAYSQDTDRLIFTSGVIPQAEFDKYKDKMKGFNLTDDELIHRMVNANAKAAGQSPSAYRATKIQEIKGAYSRNAKDILPEKKAALDSALKTDKMWQQAIIEKKNFDEAFPKKFGDPSGITPTTVKLGTNFFGGGRVDVNLDKEDQLNLALVMNSDKKWFPSEEEKKLSERARTVLNKKGITDRMISYLRASLEGPTEDYTPADMKGLKGLVKYMRQTDTDESLDYTKRKADYIKQRSAFSPVVMKVLGETKEDTDNRARLAGYLGMYAREGQNESPNFKGNAAKMQAIAESTSAGTIQFEGVKDQVTGEIKNTAFFTDKDGNFAGSMVISGQEAANVGFTPEVVYSTPNQSFASTRFAITQNNSTSFGDPTRVETYDSGDNVMNLDDFPKLRGVRTADVKANIKAVNVHNTDGTQQTKYFNYIYINDYKTGARFVKALDNPTGDMGTAVMNLESLTPQYIDKVISEIK